MDGFITNPSQVAREKGVRKTLFEKKIPIRDRNVRTPFREKVGDHSTERPTGAELRNVLVATVVNNLDT